MENTTYRVECADPTTGATVFHSFEAESPDAARAIASRLGYITGTIQADSLPLQLPALPRRGRLRIWVALGFLLIVGFVAIFAFNGYLSRMNKVDPILGVSEATMRDWRRDWPTLVFPARTPGPPKSVKVEYDEFRDYTSFDSTVDLGKSDIGPRVEMELMAVSNGRVANLREPPLSISVSLFRGIPLSREPERLGSERYGSELILIIDEGRLTIRRDRSGTSSMFDLKTKDLLRIINAKHVRGRIDDWSGAGSHEFTLDSAGIEVLREFASLLRP